MSDPADEILKLRAQIIASAVDAATTELREELDRAVRFSELGWAIIANASDGDWTKQSADWVTAAEKYRDDFHNRILPMSRRRTP